MAAIHPLKGYARKLSEYLRVGRPYPNKDIIVQRCADSLSSFHRMRFQEEFLQRVEENLIQWVNDSLAKLNSLNEIIQEIIRTLEDIQQKNIELIGSQRQQLNNKMKNLLKILRECEQLGAGYSPEKFIQYQHTAARFFRLFNRFLSGVLSLFSRIKQGLLDSKETANIHENIRQIIETAGKLQQLVDDEDKRQELVQKDAAHLGQEENASSKRIKALVQNYIRIKNEINKRKATRFGDILIKGKITNLFDALKNDAQSVQHRLQQEIQFFTSIKDYESMLWRNLKEIVSLTDEEVGKLTELAPWTNPHTVLYIPKPYHGDDEELNKRIVEIAPRDTGNRVLIELRSEILFTIRTYETRIPPLNGEIKIKHLRERFDSCHRYLHLRADTRQDFTEDHFWPDASQGNFGEDRLTIAQVIQYILYLINARNLSFWRIQGKNNPSDIQAVEVNYEKARRLFASNWTKSREVWARGIYEFVRSEQE